MTTTTTTRQIREFEIKILDDRFDRSERWAAAALYCDAHGINRLSADDLRDMMIESGEHDDILSEIAASPRPPRVRQSDMTPYGHSFGPGYDADLDTPAPRVTTDGYLCENCGTRYWPATQHEGMHAHDGDDHGLGDLCDDCLNLVNADTGMPSVLGVIHLHAHADDDEPTTIDLNDQGEIDDDALLAMLHRNDLLTDVRAIYTERDGDTWTWIIVDVDTEDSVGAIDILHGAGA